MSAPVGRLGVSLRRRSMPGPELPPTRRRTVRGDGLDLAVWQGPPTGPPVVFVHGFPDTHAVWDRVVERLAPAFSCVTYDVRGAGESEAPARRDDYRLSRLLSDLIAVLDTVAPSEPVHLVGHDWGSVQGWDAVLRERSDRRLTGRLATYTSISGPALEQMEAFLRAGWRRGPVGVIDVLRQARRSWYAAAFQLPVLPELALRRVSRQLLGRGQREPYAFAPTLERDALNGLNLYRANLLRRRPPIPGGLTTDVPVQVLVPLRDRYLIPEVQREVSRSAVESRQVDLDAGHWVQQTHADEVARSIARFAATHPSPSRLRD